MGSDPIDKRKVIVRRKDPQRVSDLLQAAQDRCCVIAERLKAPNIGFDPAGGNPLLPRNEESAWFCNAEEGQEPTPTLGRLRPTDRRQMGHLSANIFEDAGRGVA